MNLEAYICLPRRQLLTRSTVTCCVMQEIFSMTDGVLSWLKPKGLKILAVKQLEDARNNFRKEVSDGLLASLPLSSRRGPHSDGLDFRGFLRGSSKDLRDALISHLRKRHDKEERMWPPSEESHRGGESPQQSVTTSQSEPSAATSGTASGGDGSRQRTNEDGCKCRKRGELNAFYHA